MQSTQLIIDKILLDAKTEAENITNASNGFCVNQLKVATDWAEAYTLTQQNLLQKESEEYVKRRLTVAELDAKKLELKAKQDLLDKVFNRVLEKLCSLDKQSYLRLVKKLIEQNAERGDTIVLSRDKVLNTTDIEKLEVVNKLALVVSQTQGDFDGGIMLKNSVCDKDLTFKTLVKEVKEEKASLIANILF